MDVLNLGNKVASDNSLWTDVDLSYYPHDLSQEVFPEGLALRLRSATSLTISNYIRLTPFFVDELIGLACESPRLTSLSLISALDVTEENLISLFENTGGSLKHVDLSFCHHIGSEPILSLISHHPNLQSLNLSHTSFTDDGLLQLHQLRNLTDLSLQGCFNLTRVSMSKFLKHSFPPRLSKLNLSYLFTVVGEWLAHVQSSVNFERLDVRYTENITKRDVLGLKERWGTGCVVLENAKLETDDERGWRQYVDEIIQAQIVY